MEAYRVRYTDIDSCKALLTKALQLSAHYTDGEARALNRLAYVRYQEMDYDGTLHLLDRVYRLSNNQVTLLCATVMRMKVCQRVGDGRGFYEARSKALVFLKRIEENPEELDGIDLSDYHYAWSEFHIISSTYYYYQEQYDQAKAEINQLSSTIEQLGDTTQLLYYYYMLGSGGLVDGSYDEVAVKEFNYLFRCYALASRTDVEYFEANALQALAARLKTPYDRLLIQSKELDAYVWLEGKHLSWVPNNEELTDSILPVALAQHALYGFQTYHDLFQTACAYRTLGEMEEQNGNYDKALEALDLALGCVNTHHQRYYPKVKGVLSLYDSTQVSAQSIERQWIDNPQVHTVPEWMAGIRQQISMLYSAMDQKAASDYNRNIYLDILASTSQNREMESRMNELQEQNDIARRLLWAAMGVFGLLLVFIVMFVLRLKRHVWTSHSSETEGKTIMMRGDKQRVEELTDRLEEVKEACEVSQMHIARNKTHNSEKRAKVSLVHAVVPFLDRIINEVGRMKRQQSATPAQLEYVSELSEQIIEYNDILTEWIKMERGQLSLQISTLHLKPLFEILERGHFAYDQKGVTLRVEPTDLCVKADEALTMFMLNTLADNARKFTPEGGTVTISAQATDEYVELSVSDTGCGMSEVDIDTILNNKAYDASKIGVGDASQDVASHKGFGFGLMNCKGIIEKYKKTSSKFQVCRFGIESEMGKGSRFFFRLPRVLMLVVLMLSSTLMGHANEEDSLRWDASHYYQLTCQCNGQGEYEEALAYADTALYAIHPDFLLYDATTQEGYEPTDLQHFNANQLHDYTLLINLRNQIAIAALALHDMELYAYNNRVYVKLHKLLNQDRTLPSYCDRLAKAESASRQVTAVLVILSLLTIVFIYLYFRGKRRVAAQIAEDLQGKIDQTNDVLNHYRFEENRLYVQNQVLDNCLSTIKHESMYYPSRIKQLVDSAITAQQSADNAKLIEELDELTAYYKELYTLLGGQASRQVSQQSFRRETLSLNELHRLVGKICKTWQMAPADNLGALSFRADRTLLQELLKQMSLYVSQAFPQAEVVRFELKRQGNFLQCVVLPDSMHLTDEEAHNLFYPDASRIPLLIVKQIIRDFDEMNFNPGLRLVAEQDRIWWTLKI